MVDSYQGTQANAITGTDAAINDVECFSSGGPSTGTSYTTGGGISLLSITFPEFTDLSGGGVEPPPAAPLSQQVMLTFSGAVEGPVFSSSTAYVLYAE